MHVLTCLPYCNHLHILMIHSGGFTLALSHDFRVMKDNEQKGTALMAMNEVEFGASVPVRQSCPIVYHTIL